MGHIVVFCVGCVGRRSVIRHMLKGGLSWGVTVVWRMCRLWRRGRVALPGVVEVGAGITLEGGTSAMLADALGADVVGAQQLRQIPSGQRVAIPVRPGGVFELVQRLQNGGRVQRLGGAEDLA